MSQLVKTTQKKSILKSLVYIKDLKNLDMLNNKKMLLIFNQNKITLAVKVLSQSIVRNKLLIKKLQNANKQVILILKLVNHFKKIYI